MQSVLKLVVCEGQGVMDRVLGVIRRFGCNISSIAAGEVEEGVYDISIAFHTMGVDVEMLGNRLSDLDCVKAWEKYSQNVGFMREMALGKTDMKTWEALTVKGLRHLETVEGEVFFEYTDIPEKVAEVMRQLRTQGITCTRTGPVCLELPGKETHYGTE